MVISEPPRRMSIVSERLQSRARARQAGERSLRSGVAQQQSVGIIGVGHIGGNVARRLALAGHHITTSFSRDRAALSALAETIGGTAGEPPEAAAAEVVVLSVPWG
jgi:lactate dehydrogenase-like 2-hydroxyacid dehydrogenase